MTAVQFLCPFCSHSYNALAYIVHIKVMLKFLIHTSNLSDRIWRGVVRQGNEYTSMSIFFWCPWNSFAFRIHVELVFGYAFSWVTGEQRHLSSSWMQEFPVSPLVHNLIGFILCMISFCICKHILLLHLRYLDYVLHDSLSSLYMPVVSGVGYHEAEKHTNGIWSGK